MAARPSIVPAAMQAYALSHSEQPDDVQQALIAETARLPNAQMQISADIGALLTLLTRLIDARSALEIGTFTGYSAIAIARGLAPGGRLLCLDVSDEWTTVARRYWADAGLDESIELRLGPALDSVREIPNEPSIDLAFIDADKESYPLYLEELVPRIRPGGLIVADNVLQDGRVADPAETGMAVEAIRRFNEAAVSDVRLDALLLPLGDGLSVLRKR